MRTFFLYSGLAGLYSLLHEKKIAIAGVIYFAVSLFILYKYGINTNGEATKYIEDAHRIVNGENLRNGFFSNFYFIYSLLVSFFIYFSFNLQGIACIQILLSFIAACCVYKILLSETGDQKVSFITFAAYLLCLPIQKWNFFLYTESLHTSFTVAGLYFLYTIFQKAQIKSGWMLVFFLLLIIFSRPVGMIFFFTTIFIWMVWLIKKKQRVIYYPVIIGVSGLFIFLMQSKFVFYFNPDSLRRMEIICQVPQANPSLNYKEYNAAGLSSFVNVITNEIGIRNFFTLGIKKLLNFFGMVRGFYSYPHNAILFFTGIVLYPFALAGIFFFKSEKTSCLKIFSTLYIFITSVGIFFTCDEWSNRFIAPVMPYIIILAGLGLYFVKNKINSFSKANKKSL